MERTTPRMTIGWLAAAGAVGATIMSLAHWGVAVPLVADVGGVVAPVAMALAVGAALYATLAMAAFTGRTWGWTLAVIVNGLALLATLAPPFRGPVELFAIAVSLVALLVLLSRPGRRAFGR